MNKFMISPAIDEAGVHYIVRRKGWFFWSDPVQRCIFSEGVRISAEPFDSGMFGFDWPYPFKSVATATEWIRNTYGRNALIVEWRAS